MPTRPELIPTRIQRRALLCQAGANVHVFAWLGAAQGQGQGAWRELLLSHLSVLAGMGPVLLLAADLTLFWAAGRVSLIMQRRKLPA